eukprot:5844204-Alexandrium_andersonii.AAC.1
MQEKRKTPQTPEHHDRAIFNVTNTYNMQETRRRHAYEVHDNCGRDAGAARDTCRTHAILTLEMCK